MVLSGLRATTSWLSTRRVIKLLGVTTRRRSTVLAPTQPTDAGDAAVCQGDLSGELWYMHPNFC